MVAGLSLMYTLYSIQSHRSDQNSLTKYAPPASSLPNIHIFRAFVQQYKFGLPPPPVWLCCLSVYVSVLVSIMRFLFHLYLFVCMIISWSLKVLAQVWYIRLESNRIKANNTMQCNGWTRESMKIWLEID